MKTVKETKLTQPSIIKELAASEKQTQNSKDNKIEDNK